jgi:hypothetical protein
MAEDEARRAKRKAERNLLESGLSDENALAEVSSPATSDNSEDANAEGEADVGDADEGDDEEEEGPDFLLRETARIVADIAELESNQELLERRFSQLNAEEQAQQKIN